MVEFTLLNIFYNINLHSDPFGSGSESERFDRIRIRILQNIRILMDSDSDKDPQHCLLVNVRSVDQSDNRPARLIIIPQPLFARGSSEDPFHEIPHSAFSSEVYISTNPLTLQIFMGHILKLWEGGGN